jgi:hypothetical protein
LQLLKEETHHETSGSSLDDRGALVRGEITLGQRDITTKARLRFTTQSVRLQENRILRIAERLYGKDGFFGITSNYSKGATIALNYSLSAEQLTAFEGAVLGQRLVCIQGRAGTGVPPPKKE